MMKRKAIDGQDSRCARGQILDADSKHEHQAAEVPTLGVYPFSATEAHINAAIGTKGTAAAEAPHVNTRGHWFSSAHCFDDKRTQPEEDALDKKERFSKFSELARELQLLVFSCLEPRAHLGLARTCKALYARGRERGSWPSRLDLSKFRVTDGVLRSLFSPPPSGPPSLSSRSLNPGIKFLSITANSKHLSLAGIKALPLLGITALEYYSFLLDLYCSVFCSLSCSGFKAADVIGNLDTAPQLLSLRLIQPPPTTDELQVVFRRCSNLTNLVLPNGLGDQFNTHGAFTYPASLRTLSIKSWLPTLFPLDALEQSKLKTLRLSAVGVWAAQLSSLPRISSLRQLCLVNTCLAKADARILMQLPHLRSLSLIECNEMDHVLAALPGLTKLRSLHVVYTGLTKATTAIVGEMTQLTKLALAGPVQDDWLPLLSNMTCLTWLHVSQFITGGGLQRLRHLPLTFLSLACNSTLTDVDLSRFSHLMGLSLRCCSTLSRKESLLFNVLSKTCSALKSIDLRGLEKRCQEDPTVARALQSKPHLNRIIIGSGCRRIFTGQLLDKVRERPQSSHYDTHLVAPAARFQSKGRVALPEGEVM